MSSRWKERMSPLARHQGNEVRSALARLRHQFQIIAGHTMRSCSPSFAVVAALIGGVSLMSVGLAYPSPVLAQECFVFTPSLTPVPCPPQVLQGPAGVSQAAPLGPLGLLTATANSTNTSIGLRLENIRGAAPGVSPRGVSFLDGGKLGTIGTIGSLAQPLQQGGGASADSSSLASRFGVFANGLGSFGDQDTTPRQSGFDLHTAGFTIGGDYRFTDRFSLGMAFDYVKTNAEFDSSAGNFSNKAYSLSAFGTFYILEKLYVDGIVTFGWDNYET